jgi:hypothetical protein
MWAGLLPFVCFNLGIVAIASREVTAIATGPPTRGGTLNKFETNTYTGSPGSQRVSGSWGLALSLGLLQARVVVVYLS